MQNTKLLLIILITFCTSLYAQKTTIYNYQDKTYEDALELFNKQKYGSAQEKFQNVIEIYRNEENDIKTDAEYFSAICAIELFNADAEYLISSFINKHPDSPRIKAAYYQMGKYQYRKNKYEDAIVWLNKVSTYDLNNDQLAEFYFKLGYSYFMTKDYEKASKALFEIKDTESKYSIPATYYYAHIAYVNKNNETALQGFLKLKENELFGPIVPYYIVQIYFQQKKYDDIIEYAPALLDSATTKRAPEIARIIGEAYYNTQKFADAIPYLEIYKSKTKYFNREDIYQLGYAYYKTNNLQKASENFESIVNTEDEISQSAYYHLADCYLKQNLKENARMAFSSASKMDFFPDIKEDAMYNYAKLTYEIAYSPFNDAIKAFERFLEAYPESDKTDEALTYLSDLYLSTKNYKDAINSLENIKTITDKVEKAYQKVTFFHALELFNDNKFEESIINFDKSLNNSKYNELYKAQSIYWKAEAYYRLGQYEIAIKYYNEFLLTKGSFDIMEYDMAHYNLGYAYFKLADYKESLKWFRKFVGRKEINSMTVADAYNRIGDCYFISSEYKDAIDFYQVSVDANKVSVDYALFQLAYCQGLEKEYNQKVILLNQLISDHSKSSFVDDALFELGNAYIMIDASDMAMMSYENLINDYYESSYTKKALLQIGLLHYNKDEYVDAITYYKRVIAEFPNSDEVDIALLKLKDIHVDIDKVDDYFDYVKSLGGVADVSVSEQDSLTYMSAEKLYMTGDCDKSMSRFEEYISKFGNGLYILNAHFYLAECYYKNGQKDKALSSYNFIIGRKTNLFSEQSLVKASEINFANKKYNDALSNYSQLENIAEFKNNLINALVGKMRTLYLLENYSEAKKAAIKVLATERISDDVFREAHFVIAKAFYNDGKLEPAMDEFTILSQECKSKEGAESKYLLAEILFKKDKLDEASSTIFDFNKQSTPHQYWLAKGIILLADIYVKKNETFQAKHTLYSIIDNYSNKTDGVIEIANKKLQEIIENEEQEKQFDEAIEEIIKFGKKTELFEE